MIRSKRTSEKHHQNTEMYEAFEKKLNLSLSYAEDTFWYFESRSKIQE